jgi:hypothetical protein
MTSLADVFLTLTPRVLVECAMGWDDPVAVLLKNGIKNSDATALSQTPMFLSAVEEKKEDLFKSGYGMRVKSRLYSEALVDNLGRRALDPTCEHKDALETLKVLAKFGYGDTMDANAPTAPKFSITINLSATESITVEANVSTSPPDELLDEAMTIEHDTADDCGVKSLSAPTFAVPMMDL